MRVFNKIWFQLILFLFLYFTILGNIFPEESMNENQTLVAFTILAVSLICIVVPPIRRRIGLDRIIDPRKYEIDEIIIALNNELLEIIDVFEEDFENYIKDEQGLKIRVDYGPGKFYLDEVDWHGTYEYTIQNLVHHIMWEKGYYKKFLSEDELKEVKSVIDEDRDNIYKSSDKKIQTMLNKIYENVIIETATQFKSKNYFSNDKYEAFIMAAGFDVPKLESDIKIEKEDLSELYHDSAWPESPTFDEHQNMSSLNRKGNIWSDFEYTKIKSGTWYYIVHNKRYENGNNDIHEDFSENEKKMALLLSKLYPGFSPTFAYYGDIHIWVSSKEELATFDRFIDFLEACYINPNTLEYDEEYFQSKIKSLEAIISDRDLNQAFEDFLSEDIDDNDDYRLDRQSVLRELTGFNDTDEKESSALETKENNAPIPLERGELEDFILETVNKMLLEASEEEGEHSLKEVYPNNFKNMSLPLSKDDMDKRFSLVDVDKDLMNPKYLDEDLYGQIDETIQSFDGIYLYPFFLRSLRSKCEWFYLDKTNKLLGRIKYEGLSLNEIVDNIIMS